uniref:Uncharacterized protein n=1 Tax=Oryzias sinensis TaxID=183150 RepID=A0A8C8DHF0_9TELE
MALIPSQVLRAAILLSYFSILCHYKALDMPAHQTYGGSWKFLTFIDLVRERFCSVSPPTPPEIAASRDLQARRFVSQSSGTESCKEIPSSFFCSFRMCVNVDIFSCNRKSVNNYMYISRFLMREKIEVISSKAVKYPGETAGSNVVVRLIPLGIPTVNQLYRVFNPNVFP